MYAKTSIQIYGRLLTVITVALIVIGLLAIYSSSSVSALESYGNAFHFVKKQLLGICVGIAGIIGFHFFSLHGLKKISPLLFITSLMLTALTLVPGISQSIYGSSRWLRLGGFSFQPSELLKIGLVMYLAYYASNTHKKHSFFYDYLPILSIILLPALILLKQPDFGLTVTLSITTVALLFLSQFQLKHIVTTLFSILPIAAILIIMKPYRLKRVLVFLNPWNDPHGSGFQIIQSLIAIGSGGMWGVGISHSKQKFYYLPMQHTDFIFSIIAEESGFIGSTIILTLFALFLYYGFALAGQLTDSFSRLVVQGFTLLISLQAILNIAVASGLLPTKGLGLPFISYGNSALVCHLLMVGIMLRLAKVSCNDR
jgi:cell division protein FtsW